MSLEIPTKEQMLYSQLVIIDSLTDYLKDNLKNTQFDDSDVLFYMESAKDGIREVFYRMRFLIKKSQEK